MKATIIIIAILAVMFNDTEHQKAQDAAITCQDQTSISTPTYAECINNQLEVNSDK